jgi:hypothetical protein
VGLVGIAQLAHLVDVESLVGIHLEHARDQTSEFLAVPLRRRGEITFGDPLEQLIQINILLLSGSEGTTQGTQFVGDAASAPHVRLPIIPLALNNLGTHVERSTNSRECLEGLGT